MKGIETMEGIPVPNGIAFAGEHVSVIVTAIDNIDAVTAGSVVVDPTMPLPITKHFRAKVRRNIRDIFHFLEKKRERGNGERFEILYFDSSSSSSPRKKDIGWDMLFRLAFDDLKFDLIVYLSRYF